MRPTYAEIDLSAIRNNVMALRDLISPAELCAVVKADGYGHGDVPVALAAIEAGATRLAVALVEEGVRLREAGIEIPILTLSEPSADSMSELIEWDITPSVYSMAVVEALDSFGADLPVHINIDTGMHRAGARPDAVGGLVGAVIRSRHLSLEGVYTHFAVADEDQRFTEQQIELFDGLVSDLTVPLIHMANSAGAILFPDSRRDLCRVGLSLYGLHPCFETRDIVDLRPAMRVVSHISHIQRLPASARPSYGRVRPLRQESTVVTAPVGYADGYVRTFAQYGCVLIDGHRFPFAGRVTMDQIVIDVGDATPELGAEVVLMGRQGSEEIAADELAETLETITHEIVCGFGPRIPRRYVS